MTWNDRLWWQPKNEWSWRLHISSVPTVTKKFFYRRLTARRAITTWPSMNFVDNTIGRPWRNLSSPIVKFGTELQREIFLLLEILEIPYSTLKGSFRTKTSLIRSVISIRHRLVTDRQTDRHTTTAYTALVYRAARWRVFCMTLSFTRKHDVIYKTGSTWHIAMPPGEYRATATGIARSHENF